MHFDSQSNTSDNFIKLTVADFIVRSAYQMGKTPLLPLFAAALGATDIFLGLIVSVSTLTGMLLKPAVGFLSDRWGRRAWLTVGTFFFTLMPFLYWFVDTPEQLFGLRLIHGMATAIYGPVTLAYIAGQSKKRLAEKLGWFGLAREGGYIIGPALAGVLLLSLSPQLIFSFIGLVSALAFIPILRLKEPPKLEPKPLSLKKQLAQGFKTMRQSSSIWFAGLLESVNYVVLYALKAFLPIYALSAGFNVAVVGAFFAVQEAAHMIIKPVTGRLGDKLGYLRVISTGMLLLGAAVLVVMSAKTLGLLFAAAIFSGIAQALIFPSSLALVATQVDQNNLGLSMGLVGALRNAGKVLGPVLGGLLIQQFDYLVAFQILSLSLISIALLLLVTKHNNAKLVPRGIIGGTD